MYGVARWYRHTEQSQPLRLGVSFVPDYAAYLGLDPRQTMDALLNIGVKDFRLVSYWSDLEPTPGHYDFTQLDWQFQKAEAAHAKVILTLGLRQPRYPECHVPSWAAAEPENVRQAQLESFMSAVVRRYERSPALGNYQLENEFFLKGFGTCSNFDRVRLVREYALVSRLDPSHPIIIGRSNNDLGFPAGPPQPSAFSVSIYQRVWDANVTRRYLQYPFPAWYYGFLAGFQKILLHKDMIVGELQAEAWPPHGQLIVDTSLREQNKSLDARRLQENINFAKNTGMRGIYLWGAEYWYYRQQILGDPSLMNVSKQQF